jgi:undecaprenyl-diphosphatase
LESFLYSIDVAVFRWVNEGWSSPFLDRFFRFVTDYHHFLPVLVPFLLYLLVWGRAKGRWLVAALALALLASDQGSSHLVKFMVHRLRPCNVLPGVLTPDGKSSAFSFPSSHAANMGASMLLLSLAFRSWTWFFVLAALLAGLSRVYLGLHYPSDILGGYLLGLLIGWAVWTGKERLQRAVQERREAGAATPGRSMKVPQDRRKKAKKKVPGRPGRGKRA